MHNWLLFAAGLVLLLAGCRKTESSGAAAATSGPEGARNSKAGIEEPLDLGAVKLKVTSVEFTNTYTLGGVETIRPKGPDNTFAVVSADATGTAPKGAVEGWKGAVSARDDKDKKYTPEITMTGTRPDRPDLVTVKWLFVVPRSCRSLTLHLPAGKTVVLDSLLKPG
jgi:hypothetical protein